VVSVVLRGFALGFAVAASPGPIFFLCLRRTLVQGRLCGLVSGLGVATADGFYAAVATFGVAALIAVFVNGRPLALAGGVVLVALGARILLQRSWPAQAAVPMSRRGLAWAYASTLGLTITNPATIVSFAALATTLGLGAGGSPARPAAVAAAVLAGSASWWCALAFAASALRARLTQGLARGISVFSGAAIVSLGMVALYSAFR